MRRISQERQDARRGLYLAIDDINGNDPTEVQLRAFRRVVRAAREVLTHVLTKQDYVALDGLRSRRRQKIVSEAAAEQLPLPALATDHEDTERDMAVGDQPACIEPSCRKRTGARRYEGRCAACADQHEAGTRKQRRAQ